MVCSTRIVFDLNLLFLLTKKKVEGSRRGSRKGSRKGEECPEGGSRYCLQQQQQPLYTLFWQERRKEEKEQI